MKISCHVELFWLASVWMPLLLTWLGLSVQLAAASVLHDAPRNLGDGRAPLLSNATASDVELARQVVKDAIARATKLNKARLANPARNHYTLAPGTVVGGGKVQKRAESIPDTRPPPLLDITPEIAAAAALVAEADAAGSQVNATKRYIAPRGSFWMEGLARKGTSPWGNDPSYKIFRNVKDYGAKGDGITDDTAAIQKAVSDGKRCGAGCNGSTTKNAIVYLPPGTYLVSSTISIWFGTQLIGDLTVELGKADEWPVIKAAASFAGLGVLSTDEYVGNGAGPDGKDNEWYVNTASFYRQIRNLRIDITATDPGASVCGIHYQIAQATSLQYVELIAKTGTTQQGIFSENGSGGVMADIIFTGGAYGFYGGNQQFTAQRLTFNGCDCAVQVIWDWGWVWKSIRVSNSNVGFRLFNWDGSGNVGSASFLDSVFTNVKQAIVIEPPSPNPGSGSTGVVLDNVGFEGVSEAIVDTNGNTVLAGGDGIYDDWVLGPVYRGPQSGRAWSTGTDQSTGRQSSLLGAVVDGLEIPAYFERPKPQYEGYGIGDFVHLKDLGAKGDGKSDDTTAVQNALNGNVGKIIFADAGVYLLSDTVVVPPGTKIVGEAWTQLAATGSKFSDASHPKVMLQIGNPGDKGSVEMQDLLFTTKGPTPGAVLVEWNILADSPGSAGLWDCHARLGGATGTGLTPAECPALANGQVNSGCETAALVMHITQGASGYFENMWLWTADHMIDDPDLINDKNEMTMISVYTARGLLIESQEPTWLYGTASEHAIFYQYNFFSARNILAGLIQTESPYFQPTPSAPRPYKANIGAIEGDPDYTCTGNSTGLGGCDSSWAVLMSFCGSIYIASAGLYSWFDTYTQDCIDVHSCQEALVLLENNYNGVRLQQVITIGAKYSIMDGNSGVGVLSTDNLAVTGHPAWSQISLYDAGTLGNVPPVTDDENLDPCASPGNWRSLDDLQNAMGLFPDYCLATYAMPILYDTLHVALHDYTDINNGYDNKFNAYVNYIKQMVPIALQSYLNNPDGPGNKFFTCTVEINGRNETSYQCPVGYWLDTYFYYTLYYQLNDEEGFFTDLEKTYGITKDWVKFGEKIEEYHCHNGPNDPPCDSYKRVYEGIPLPADTYTVANPKDIISGSLDGYNNLLTTLMAKRFELLIGQWDGAGNDVLEAVVMPVFMVQEAVDAMKQVVIVGDEAEAEKKKQLILTILGVVFLVLPFVGEGLGPEIAVISSLGRMISLIGEVGNVALSAYDIYQDPTSAPLEIIGTLMGAGFGRDAKSMEKMASLRRGMDAGVVAKLGAKVEKYDTMVQNMMKFCNT